MNSTRNNSTRMITDGLNATSANNSNSADDLNPHSNSNNATLMRLREKIQANKSANATSSHYPETLESSNSNFTTPPAFRVENDHYQINSTQEVTLSMQLRLLASSLNLTLNDIELPGCESVGPEVYRNEMCYAEEGMDRSDWNTLMSVNGCDNTTTLSDELKNILDDGCNTTPNNYFETQAYYTRLESTLGASAALLVFLCFCAMLRSQRSRYIPVAQEEAGREQPSNGYSALCGGDDENAATAHYRP
jgi:hypothetical protein